MRDFTLEKYRKLIEALKNRKYDFQTFSGFLENSGDKVIVMRHDVDRLPINALVMAGLEKDFGIKGSYYFRTVAESYDENIIRKISEMGHEIGYHYESMDKVTTLERSNQNKTVTTLERSNQNESNKDEIVERAYELFCEELEKFRKLVDVKTICMHGSPRGKFDNKMIWEKYDYRQLGIIGEPYLDIDWNDVGYLTDTGRRWNGDKFSIRDKVNSKYKFDFKTTDDIINNIEKLPVKLMINVHPHRWFNFGIMWIRELILQNVKNTVKYIIVRRQK